MSWQTSRPTRKMVYLAASFLWCSFFVLVARVLDLNIPYLPLAIAGAFAFYLRNWPATRELCAWILLSVGLAFAVHFPHDHNWIHTASGVLALFGFGAFLMLGLRWLWSDSAERRRTYAVLAPAASLVFFVLSAQRALSLANLLYPKTYDLYLYLADGSFGFQPSFLMGRAMAYSSVLRIAAQLTYVSLPFVMGVVYALRLPKNTERPSWDLITLFLLAGLGGWALYNIVPAAGPAYVFAASFPWQSIPYPALKRLFMELIPVNGDVPRNAIPSLHMAWVLLLYWNGKNLSRSLQIFLSIYLALTVVSTLGTGEHYFVDLIAGLPFAFTVQAIVAPGIKPSISRRAVAAGSGFALTLFWLWLVRLGGKVLLVTPILPWGLFATTVAVVWRLQHWFDSEPKIDQALPSARATAACAAR